MNLNSIIGTVFCLLIFISCKKTGEKFCWQIQDDNGNKVNIVCDKTEKELRQCITDGSCVFPLELRHITPCRYFKIEGDKKCWMVGNDYLQDIVENDARAFSNCFGGGVEPVETSCRDCKVWYHRKKMTFKPANTFLYSVTKREYFCGDTARTLFQGRQIIIKDDADSLIVIQFSNNGTNW